VDSAIPATLATLIETYGYWIVAGIIALESMGLPLPGETTLVAASLYAGSTHRLEIWLVVLAAAAGAIIGDNIGFWIGREGGLRLLERYGSRVGLGPARLRLGRYMFRLHGGKVVFFGRFVAMLRALAAVLAGANRMDWQQFLAFNAAGGVIWAGLYGGGAYLLGDRITRVVGPIGLAALGIAAVAAFLGFRALWRREAAWQAHADAMFPDAGRAAEARLSE
jgi:membrane protein DedA with SNARE-associated domain